MIPITIMITMVFAIPPVVIEVAILCKIGLMFSVEPVVIVVIVSLVVIVSMPAGIRIMAISRIILFVDADFNMCLRAGGMDRK